VFGSDFHDGYASPINVSGVRRLELVGIHVWGLDEPPGSDPEDLSHLNTISLLGGSVTDVSVRDSWFEGGRANHQTDSGDIVRLSYENVWYEGAWGSAFQFNATNGNRIRESSRTSVRTWDHRGSVPRDRLDIVDGRATTVAGSLEEVDVTDRSIIDQPPEPDAVDPATSWRLEHPYDSWPSYFGWADAPAPGEGAGPPVDEQAANPAPGGAEDGDDGVPWPVLVGAAVGIAIVVAWLVRRRGRRNRTSASFDLTS
jgi:hypothetical protein